MTGGRLAGCLAGFIVALQGLALPRMMMIFAPTQPLMANASPPPSMSFIPCSRSEAWCWGDGHDVARWLVEMVGVPVIDYVIHACVKVVAIFTGCFR